jgi:nucleotide-binding universal stress UspA family protein
MATSKLSTLAERLDGRGLRITTEVRSGAIAQDINNAVIACGADLVVMATRRRSDLPHPLIGSVVERLIRTACCPVLVVRPSGQVRVHRQVPALQHEELVAEVCVA